MIDTIIFDLDGTLLDTLTDLHSSVNHALSLRGHPSRSLEEIRAFVGNGALRLITLAAPEECAKEEISLLLALFNEHYAVHSLDTTAPYSGILELLSLLKSKGIRLAVVSNKPDYGVKSLCDRFFSDSIDFCLGQKDGFPKKPAPDMIFSTLQALESLPENTVYVGDSEVDLQTARNAGIPCLAVDWGFRSREQLLSAGAEETFSTPDSLYQRVLQLLH